MSQSYDDLMNMSWDEIPDTKVLPVGTWRLRGKSVSYKEAKDGDSNPYFMFVYTPQEPGEDVDADDLMELGADYVLSNNKVFFRMWVEGPSDMKAVMRHLAKHGIDVESGNIGDSLKAFKGTEVMAELTQRTFTDNSGDERVENDAQKFAAVE